MRAIIAWELERRKWWTLWWTIGISGLIALTVLAYSAFNHQTQQLDQAFQGLTDSAGAFFGGTDFFSPVGYLSSQIYFILLPLLLIIMATTLAASLLSREETDRTIELTLARPVSRNQLLAAKGAAGFVLFATVCVLSFVVTAVSVAIADLSIPYADLLLTHVICFLFAMSFGIISFVLMALSQATRRLASVIAIAIGLGGYVVTSLSSFVDWLEVPAKLMPYHYYDTQALLTGHVNRGLLIYFAALLIVASLAAAAGYNRRDIG